MVNEKWKMENLVSLGSVPLLAALVSFAPGLTFSYTSTLPFCGLMITGLLGFPRSRRAAFIEGGVLCSNLLKIKHL
jgi:hypothetical protein